MLAGSELDLPTALAQASVIVVGEVLDAGVASPDIPGEMAYDEVRIRITERVRGIQSGSGELELNYDCRTLPAEQREEPAAAGGRYVFFLVRRAAGYWAIKILPATAEVLSAVRQP